MFSKTEIPILDRISDLVFSLSVDELVQLPADKISSLVESDRLLRVLLEHHILTVTDTLNKELAYAKAKEVHTQALK